MDIVRAAPEDAEEILVLQRLAYEVEARLYDDWQIPPLTETVEQLRQDIVETVVLTACSAGRIVGSVRGRLTDESACYIGRLIVHPDSRRQGIATRMMRELEMYFPAVPCFELFTGVKSAGNISLYRSLGYEEVRREAHSAKITIIFMRKSGPAL